MKNPEDDDLDIFEEGDEDDDIKTNKHSFDNYNIKEIIELLSTCTNFEKEELGKMTEEELRNLWHNMEMEEWLTGLDDEN